jgi:hypothetical protein
MRSKSVVNKITKELLKANEEDIKKLEALNKGWHRTYAKKFVQIRPDIYSSIEQARSAIRTVTDNNGKQSRKTLNPIDKFEVTSNKKIGTFHWKDAIQPLKDLKTLFDNGKSSQDYAHWKVTTNQDICVVVVGDLHAGSWATDYDLFIQITEEIINTPNLYVILVGDLLQMSIKLRGVLEVSDNALPPKWQLAFLESWLEDIKHKVICSTWDNHSVMREENATGYSRYADIFQRSVIYHDNIGHIDIQVNDQIYKIAAAHFFRGRTMYNPCHGQMRYMRMTSNDREVCIAGDSHESGLLIYNEGGTKKRIAINCGSIQNGGYGKRFFSLVNNPDFPCIRLSHKEHLITPFYSVKEWLNS